MYPSFDLGPLHFPAYFTLLIGGYTIVILLAHREGLRIGLDGNRILDLAMVMLFMGILGARALHVAADDGAWEYYRDLCVAPLEVKGEWLPGARKCTSDDQCAQAEKGELCHPTKGTCHQGRDCLRAVKFWYGGLAFYGGLALAAVVGYWFLRRHRMPIWKVGDLAGFAIPLGLVFGRLGCFLTGCCFGEACPTCHGAIAFPSGTPAWEHHVEQGLIPRTAAESLPVYPTQLWEAGACLAIFLYLWFWLRKRRRFDGQLFFEFMMLYAVARFAIEFWRDDPRGIFLGLATSQWIAFPMFAYGAYMWIGEWRRLRAGGSSST